MQRILIVDDKEQERYLLRVLLEKSGYAVDSANNGIDALKSARARPPDLVVSDILMPTMDGFNFCKEWQQDGGLCAIPFIFYTATYTDPRDEDFALKLGAVRFIVKPVDPEVLVRHIQEVLALPAGKAAPEAALACPDEQNFLKNYNETLVRKLEDKLELFRAIFTIDSNILVILSPAHSVQELNLAAQKTLGVDPLRAFQENFADVFVAPAFRSVFTDRVRCALSGNTVEEFESALVTAGGQQRTILWNAQCLVKSSGVTEGVLLVGVDVTERKQALRQREILETQLRQAQKLEAIGTFAAGIAHDFNNVLTGIIGFVEMSRLDVQNGSMIEKNLREALRAANRAKSLIAQMLQMSRRGEEQFRPNVIAPIIRETVNLLRVSIRRDVKIGLDIDDDDATVQCDASQIQQVLMNLCTNAYHALGRQPGAIRLKCRTVRHPDGDFPASPDLAPGPYVVIDISDTGKGMDTKTLERIFDPYFTTKQIGQGTGLGLPVSKAIVQAHKGCIRVQSVEGRGSVFSVYLPLLRFQASVEQPPDHDTMENGNGVSVLVVEDDEIIGPMLAEALSRMHYRVNLVANGDEAIACLSAGNETVGILLSDFTLPKMNGLELSRKAHALKPDLPIILMSGSSEAMPADLIDSLGIRAFIKKPFGIGELSQILNRCVKTKQ